MVAFFLDLGRRIFFSVKKLLEEKMLVEKMLEEREKVEEKEDQANTYIHIY